MNRRLISMRYDITAGMLREEDGSEVRTERLPFIYSKEKPLVNLLLVTNSALAPLTTLDGTNTFEAVIDNSFSSLDLMCKTLASGINQPGEWWDGTIWTDADSSLGQISIRLNANTVSFVDKLDTNSEVMNTRLELQINQNNDAVASYMMLFRCLNRVNADAASPLDQSNYGLIEKTDPSTGQKYFELVTSDGTVIRTFV